METLQLELLRCPVGEEVLFRLANSSIYVSKHTVILPVRIMNTMHEKLLTLRVIEAASFLMIFGMPWLRRHCPKLYFDTMQVQMSCIENGRCFPARIDSDSSQQDELNSTTTASNNIALNDSSRATQIVASTIMENPALPPTLEPTADPFFGHTLSITLQLPPIDFVCTVYYILAGSQSFKIKKFLF
ncbi:unnamed protein product [Mucor fragilis]